MTRLAALSLAVFASSAGAQTFFYQRATQGTTGQTSGSGIAVSNLFYTGWRFQVTDGPIQTVHIGGHFFAGSGTVFGALVRLTGPNDDPDQFNLTSSDVIATNLITLPPFAGGSAVAQGDMNVTLVNGWYLVVFGSGAFGATSGGDSLIAQDASTAVPGAQLNITYRQAAAAGGELAILQGSVARVFVEYVLGEPPSCYPNCDQSTGTPFLNVADFTCFLQKFAQGNAYANCDGSTNTPVLNVADFTCFLQKFAQGCSAP